MRAHVRLQMFNTFMVLFQQALKPGGIFIMEDLFVARTKWYTDGDKDHIMIEVVKDWIEVGGRGCACGRGGGQVGRHAVCRHGITTMSTARMLLHIPGQPSLTGRWAFQPMRPRRLGGGKSSARPQVHPGPGHVAECSGVWSALQPSTQRTHDPCVLARRAPAAP